MLGYYSKKPVEGVGGGGGGGGDVTGGREINIYFTIYSVLNMVTRYIKRRNSLRLILKKDIPPYSLQYLLK